MKIRSLSKKRILLALQGALACTSLLWVTGCMHDSDEHDDDGHAHASDITLYVGGASAIAAYDLGTGTQKSGEIGDVGSLTDMQALADGTVLVSNGAKDNVVIFDGATLLEKSRQANGLGAKRPVHTFVSPVYGGKQYFAAMHDGNGAVGSDAMLLIDIAKSSSTYLKAVGEIGLALGHHKASFSKTQPRIVVTSINACDEVAAVYDFTDVKAIQKVKAFSAADIGMDGSSRQKTCDPTRAAGILPSAHGGATSSQGRAYHNLTGLGQILSVDLDAAMPTARLLNTQGAGAGYTKAVPGSKYVYSLQSSPREGDATRPGLACQIGQLVVIDAALDSVVNEVALFLKGPNCRDSLATTPYKTVGPGHIVIAQNTNRLFIQATSGFSDAVGYAEHHLVLDMSDVKNPVQQASLSIGKSRSHHAETLSGDGKWFVVGNNLDATVSVIDVEKAEVVKTINTVTGPSTLTTFGEESGPSYQTGPIK
jgi:hypothetical protein